MFEADKMVGPVDKDLMSLTMPELRAELEARGASKIGRTKVALRMRLRALMIRAAMDVRASEEAAEAAAVAAAADYEEVMSVDSDA